MAARKPRVEYYWTQTRAARSKVWVPQVNWRLVGANGEIMCQSTQGFRDKADARRSVCAVGLTLTGHHPTDQNVREVGPARKPA